jgi:hypothetical protein
VINAYQTFNQSDQKNYTKEEEGKWAPYRTFLTVEEIVIICVSLVILLLLLVLLGIYLKIYGCVLPPCCRRSNKDYTEIQRNRDQKIAGIWENNS